MNRGGQDLVADASALVNTLILPDLHELRQRLRDATCHAPHLVDAEVGQALRKHARKGLISAEMGQTVLTGASQLVDHRYPHTGPIAQLAWQLRHSVSFYDALYVALAAALDVPLLTADSKLANAHGLPCKVEVVG
ncbi:MULTISPECIES: PIN domain-containing protein [unclassified Crossiella]|uniref:type II toxin-antitoxin system VapC family toxin n=1 Tax=unclassified Crossiella TaxID=2620835 RepID=UPI001FFFD96F|nr:MULTISPECIES: PIN domain-containing protein [unclassified Crossiella]MCK2240371.1 PIN domain-containing protein [Crossiella sp. S99.2]MCK2253177.1 PIN domain-containing protein [Crossiella sp. S99.1]